MSIFDFLCCDEVWPIFFEVSSKQHNVPVAAMSMVHVPTEPFLARTAMRKTRGVQAIHGVV